MNSLSRFFLSAAALALAASSLRADHVAPENFANYLFNGTITSATGGANANGTFSLVFTGAGMDHTVSTTGVPVSDPVPYTYTRTGEQTATITEPLAGGGTLTINLTFTAAAGDNGGTFVANYGGGKTQSGSFVYLKVPAPAPLVNMSNRTMVPAGGTTIAGLVVGGAVPRRVLSRAVGPGLTAFGVTGVLSNPRITVYRGSQVIATNDDWSSDAAKRTELEAAFVAAGAFGLTAGSTDAAMVATLEPGIYTVVVSGGSATDSGNVILETYYID